ncbi:hypothetical protein [Vibrio harveyi]|uniref:hypothetical protein n=1 Tax=Vibrio harveyi TaxID=669 RepID=UPI00165D9F15|nr:hypothetical protein [Vibrio harveyi]
MGKKDWDNFVMPKSSSGFCTTKSGKKKKCGDGVPLEKDQEEVRKTKARQRIEDIHDERARREQFDYL